MANASSSVSTRDSNRGQPRSVQSDPISGSSGDSKQVEPGSVQSDPSIVQPPSNRSPGAPATFPSQTQTQRKEDKSQKPSWWKRKQAGVTDIAKEARKLETQIEKKKTKRKERNRTKDVLVSG